MQQNIEQITQIALNALEDIKGENILLIDTVEQSSLFSKIIICTGTSNRHTKSLANNVIEELKKQEVNIIGIEGQNGGEWVLVDTGDVVVHVMLPQVRAYYDLEGIWKHASN